MPPGVADLVTRAGGVVATALVVVAPCVMAAAVVVAVLAEACEEAEAAPTRYRYTIAYNCGSGMIYSGSGYEFFTFRI